MNTKVNKPKSTTSSEQQEDDAWDNYWAIDKTHFSRAECFIIMILKIIGFIFIFPLIMFAPVSSIAPSSEDSASTSSDPFEDTFNAVDKSITG